MVEKGISSPIGLITARKLLKALFITFLLLVTRKIYVALSAVHFVNACWHSYSIESLRGNADFQVLE